jgi:hypothetical protein
MQMNGHQATAWHSIFNGYFMDAEQLAKPKEVEG